MFCTKCGAELQDGMKFCIKCGTVVEQPISGGTQKESVRKERLQTIDLQLRDKQDNNSIAGQEAVVTKRKKGGWGLKIGIISILVVLVIGGVSSFLFGGMDTYRVYHNLFWAKHYLEENDYEQAITGFEEVISIDPKSEEAYLGLAETYIALEDYESAIEVLQEGICCWILVKMLLKSSLWNGIRR